MQAVDGDATIIVTDGTLKTQRRRSWIVVVTLVLAMYLTTASTTALTPFLIDVTRELGVDLGAMGVLLSVSSITWAIVSAFAGVASDRVGRRPLLLVGLLGMALGPLVLASTHLYWVALLSRLAGGFGGGAFTGSALAAASDAVPPAERGRALGWLITGQSLALVLGVPMVTYLAAFIGWRASMAIQGAALIVAVVLVWLVVPAEPRRARTEAAPRPSVLRLLTPKVLALLSANTMERICYGGVAVFLATYLVTSYGISLEVLALGLAVVALGTRAGSLLGGELSDRLRSRTLLAAGSLALTGLLALPLLLWQPGLLGSIALGFVYLTVNAVGRPALLASTSEVSNEARGALLGANMTFASFGWLGAQALGGWLIGTYGFSVFAMLTTTAGLLGALLAGIGMHGRTRAAT
jgi:predicted MFS family arabinose efflux permease